MPDFTTIYEFRGGKFRVAVRRHSVGKRFRITIIGNQSANGQRHRIEFECGGSRSATELATLLKRAAVMAEHLEGGGNVEIWS